MLVKEPMKDYEVSIISRNTNPFVLVVLARCVSLERVCQ